MQLYIDLIVLVELTHISFVSILVLYRLLWYIFVLLIAKGAIEFVRILDFFQKLMVTGKQLGILN